MGVISQQEEIKQLKAQVNGLEYTNSKLNADLNLALQERDEWKNSALRMQMNREFNSAINRLERDEQRFLKPTCGSAIPDFEHALQQQLQLAQTPLQRLSPEGD